MIKGGIGMAQYKFRTEYPRLILTNWKQTTRAIGSTAYRLRPHNAAITRATLAAFFMEDGCA